MMLFFETDKFRQRRNLRSVFMTRTSDIDEFLQAVRARQR
jgi:hypothetical protein